MIWSSHVLEHGRHRVVVHRHGEQIGAGAEELLDELVLDRGGLGLLRGVLGGVGEASGDACRGQVRDGRGREVAVHDRALPLGAEGVGDLA